MPLCFDLSRPKHMDFGLGFRVCHLFESENINKQKNNLWISLA
jgi:hypothetical protein